MSVIGTVAIVVLGGTMGYLFYQIHQKKQIETQKKAEKLLPGGTTIKDVGAGGVIALLEFSPSYQDVDLVVERVHRYTFGEKEWIELVCRDKDQKLFLEWQDTDGELFVTASTRWNNSRLSTLNLREDDLVQMDEAFSNENYIESEGERFYFEQSGEVLFYENKAGEGEGFYLWTFINDARTKTISIEKWENQPFEIFSGRVVQPSKILIYKT